MVGQYCYGLIPGMWPLVLGLTLMKFLQVRPAQPVSHTEGKWNFAIVEMHDRVHWNGRIAWNFLPPCSGLRSLQWIMPLLQALCSTLVFVNLPLLVAVLSCRPRT